MNEQHNDPASASSAPLTWKIILAAGVILIAGMAVFAVHSVFNALRVPPAPSDGEVSAAPPAVPPSPSGESFPDSSPAPAPFEKIRQRERARTETIAALKREAQEKAGTNVLAGEAIRKIEKSDPYIQ